MSQLLTSPTSISLPTLIPGFNTLHAMALLWLRPSKQIRAPLYSLKQARQRRNIIARYGVLFYLNFAIFLALIIVSRIRPPRSHEFLSDPPTPPQVPVILRDTINLDVSGINL